MRNLAGVNKFFGLLGKPKKKDIDLFLSYAHEHTVVIEHLDEPNTGVEIFSSFDRLLEGKRVVYLGEEDHWIHEKSDYRLLLLRYLISRGFRYIGEELGWSDGMRIDSYLEIGNVSFLERIATYGYKGNIRPDRNDKAVGILKASSENYPVAEFKSEQLRLTKALREISKKCEAGSDRIHFFGFDIDTVTGGGYEDIEGLLNPVKDEPSIAEIIKSLKRVKNETLEDEIKRLGRVLNLVNSLEPECKKLLGERQYPMLEECVRTLIDSFEFNRMTIHAADYKEVNAAMPAREEVIQHHVGFVLSQMKHDDKLVLMGHNRHLSKDFEAIKNAGAAPPGGYRVPSIGTYINRLLPGQVFSIWELHDHGSSSQPFTGLSRKYTSVPGSLNSILAKAGSNYLISTAEVPLFQKEMNIAGIYNDIFRTAIAKQADAIFFINEVSPLRI